LLTVLGGCTSVTFDNPIDERGTAFPNGGNPAWLEDHDGDGIANYFDTDSDNYVRDTSGPVITVSFPDSTRIPLNDSTSIKIEKLKTMYTVTDNRDQDLTCNVTIKDLSTFQPSVGKMYFTAIDSDLNTDTVVRVIIIYAPGVKDTRAPSLTFQLTNNDTTEVEFGSTIDYLENVFSWDYEENVLYTDSVKWTGTVNTSIPAVYPVVYTVKDTSNNIASKTRYFKVLPQESSDTRKPTITLKWPEGYKDKDTIRLVLPAQYVEPGYSAYDSVDGDLTGSVKVNNPIKPNSTFNGYITYEVKNSAGTPAREFRWVKITGGIDLIPPVITLLPTGFKDGDTTEVRVGTEWKDPGYTVTDNQDPNPKVTVAPTTISTATEGVHKITYSAMDADSNVSKTVTRWVKVTKTLTNGDNTKPALKLLGKNPDTVFIGSTWTDPGYETSDNSGVTPKVTVTPDLKDFVFTKDTTYKIVYTAKDTSGNDSTLTRTLRVKKVPTGSLLEDYNIDEAPKLPAINGEYSISKIEGDDEPKFEGLRSMKLNWSGSQLHDFALNYNVTPYYQPLTSSTNSFGSSKPKFTLAGTPYAELNGEYYVVVAGTNLVWVKIDGSFAIVWQKTGN